MQNRVNSAFRHLRFFLWMVLLCLIGFMGCTTLTEWWNAWFGDERDYLVHLHFFTLTPKEERQRMYAVEYLPGRLLYLEQPALLTSVEFDQITIQPHPKGKGKSLEITLSPHGKMVWAQITAANLQRQVVVMVDQEYRGWIQIDKLNDTGILTLSGPFPDTEAEKIVERLVSHQKRRNR